jgi:hypothetical protein
LSQVLTLYTTPVVYLYLNKFQVRLRELTGRAPKRRLDPSLGIQQG